MPADPPEEDLSLVPVVVGLAVLEIILLAGPAFAVGARAGGYRFNPAMLAGIAALAVVTGVLAAMVGNRETLTALTGITSAELDGAAAVLDRGGVRLPRRRDRPGRRHHGRSAGPGHRPAQRRGGRGRQSARLCRARDGQTAARRCSTCSRSPPP
ncbi:hypothetical protein [Actinoplanes solisilvae]|uniref:hypothetical protein n=1 Tax=Actinoplanes solisilvae TaxID=2486853 RepID=UPI000FD85AE5|nr:hypothetical protein [Actinoplanes solisilvae]